MCGICGIYSKTDKPISPVMIQKMTKSINHRGPDGKGFYEDSTIALGHRRLSIIDLEGGSQPLSNEDGSIIIVFNGEVYNYIELRKELINFGHNFKTDSDTEVIVHSYEQWGKDCVKRFNGMFAFAIWNKQNKELFIARDHLGVKPLYYVNIDGRFMFASEIKALLQDPKCPREVDIEALSELFTYRYVPSPKTLFKNIFKLPPGHRIVITLESMTIDRYWKWVPDVRKNTDEKLLIEEYQCLLEDAIKLQLRSDVPLGLFLSSGVDSAVLLSIMKDQVSGPVQAFTIGFEGGEKTNEVTDASKIAEMFGADHHFMIVSPSDYMNYYEKYIWDLEEPVGNETAAAFYFVSKVTSQKVKVALTGQGADEPWAGYDRYKGIKLSQIYSRLPKSITDNFSWIINKIPGRYERLQRGVLSLSEKDMLTRFTKVYSFFSADMKRELFIGTLRKKNEKDPYVTKNAIRWLQKDVEHLDPLSQMLFIDTRANLPDDLLMVGDKTSMANSLEARVPYLDFRLVEFIESLPSRLRLKGFTGKYLHKKASEKYIPKEFIYRKKKGFSNPVETWLRTKMKSFVEDYLLSPNSASSIYFDQKYIKKMLDNDRSGREQFKRHIYLLISFEMWHRTFI